MCSCWRLLIWRSIPKHNYQPSSSLIIPWSFKEHPSANHYSVQSQIIANRWMLFQVWWKDILPLRNIINLERVSLNEHQSVSYWSNHLGVFWLNIFCSVCICVCGWLCVYVCVIVCVCKLCVCVQIVCVCANCVCVCVHEHVCCVCVWCVVCVCVCVSLWGWKGSYLLY